MQTAAWLYILGSRYRGTLYTGVAANLAKRVWEHREARGSKFTTACGVFRLVYAEPHASDRSASP